MHLGRRKFFHNFWPLPPYCRQFFTTIRRQIWQIFDPSPLKNADVLNKEGVQQLRRTNFPNFDHLAWSNEQLWIKNAIFSRKVIGKMASTNALLWMRLKVCDFQKLWHFSSLSTMWLLCTIHGLKKFLIQLWRISQPGNSSITSFLNPWIPT